MGSTFPPTLCQWGVCVWVRGLGGGGGVRVRVGGADKLSVTLIHPDPPSPSMPPAAQRRVALLPPGNTRRRPQWTPSHLPPNQTHQQSVSQWVSQSLIVIYAKPCNKVLISEVFNPWLEVRWSKPHLNLSGLQLCKCDLVFVLGMNTYEVFFPTAKSYPKCSKTNKLANCIAH